MRAIICSTCLTLGLAAPTAAWAAEGGFSVYGLGGSALDAGVTPPPGTYITRLASLYQGVIQGTATVGGVPSEAGASAGFFVTGLNLLYVPEADILGGHLGLSFTLPVGFVDLAANVTT